MPAPATEYRVVGWPWPFHIVSYRDFDDYSGMNFENVRIIDRYSAIGSDGDDLGVPYALNAIKDLGIFLAASMLLFVVNLLLRRKRISHGDRLPVPNSRLE